MDSKVVVHDHLPVSEEEVDIKKQKLNEKDSFDDHAVLEDKSDAKKQNLDEENKVVPSREQRLEWFMSTFENREQLEKDDEEEYDSDGGTHALTFRDFASFELDMYESGGFDVQDYSKVNDAGMIRTYYDPAAGITDGEDYMDEIMDCARLAILKYNTDKGTHFGVEHVIKTNVEPVCPYRYYITFDALDGTLGIKESFEAVVDIHIPITERTVTMVRIRQPPRLFSLEDADDMADPTIAPRCASCGLWQLTLQEQSVRPRV